MCKIRVCCVQCDGSFCLRKRIKYFKFGRRKQITGYTVGGAHRTTIVITAELMFVRISIRAVSEGTCFFISQSRRMSTTSIFIEGAQILHASRVLYCTRGWTSWRGASSTCSFDLVKTSYFKAVHVLVICIVSSLPAAVHKNAGANRLLYLRERRLESTSFLIFI